METPSEETVTPGVDSRPAQGPLLIVSNRGPVDYYLDESGAVQGRRGSGGLAIALASVMKSTPVTWIAGAVSDTDRLVAARGVSVDLGEEKRLRLVDVAPEAYDLSYGLFCNPMLWFLQHSLWDLLERDDLEGRALHAWENGYLPVNEAFAQAVADELQDSGGSGRVMLHDYHLYAAPLFIRNQVPRAALQHFLHIPWPRPEAWEALPKQITQSICEGLLANDSVVFQTERCAQYFTQTCEAFLPDSQVERDSGALVYRGRRTRVWANPISVDVVDLRRWMSSPKAGAYRERLAPRNGEQTIVRVDRLDPTKNITGGFRAYDLLLDRHPELVGRVRFLAFLVPSRTGISEYRAYTEEVFALVDKINERYGRPDWQPVTVFHEHNRLQALAAMGLYDVLLVNPLRDGMNLVSKEGPVVNEKDGVLVLSETTGSFVELGDAALSVQPDDLEGTAEALYAALKLPADERQDRSAQLRKAIVQHDLSHWFRLLVDDISARDGGAGADRAGAGLHQDDSRWVGARTSA